MAKIDVEKIVLLVFLSALLIVGPSKILNHSIKHHSPYGYFASDAFQHQTRAEAIKDMGSFKYEAPYISKGIEHAAGRYPPLLYHVSVIFSQVSGLEVYDAIYFLVLVFPLAGILCFYFVIRNFSRNVALLSLPLTVFAYSWPLSMGFFFGHWPSVFSQVFLFLFFWCILRMDMENSFVLISVSFASVLMAHTSEAAFGIVFLAVFLAFRMIAGNLKIKELKMIAASLFISSLITAYYLIIFYQTFGKSQFYSFTVEPVWNGNPGFYISGFGILLVPVIAGLAFSLFRFKEMNAAIAVGISMLVGGFMNYAGFTFRSFQIRFFWPIYLSVLFGFGLYMLAKLVLKKSGIISVIVIVIIFSIPAFGIVKVPGIPKPDVRNDEGVMDRYHWDSLSWISKNTEKNSKIYFFYGDIYDQDALLRNSKRFHAQVEPWDFIKQLQERQIKRVYSTEVPGDSGGGIIIRNGVFSFGQKPNNDSVKFVGPWDICGFDYFVFDKVSRQPVLAQYNMLLASKISEKGAVKAFENEVVVILQNKNKGGSCIEEGTF